MARALMVSCPASTQALSGIWVYRAGKSGSRPNVPLEDARAQVSPMNPVPSVLFRYHFLWVRNCRSLQNYGLALDMIIVSTGKRQSRRSLIERRKQQRKRMQRRNGAKPPQSLTRAVPAASTATAQQKRRNVNIVSMQQALRCRRITFQVGITYVCRCILLPSSGFLDGGNLLYS